MLIKSYQISKKNLNSLNFFLIYGKNIGFKQDITKSVLELKEKRNEKYKVFKFEEEEIIKNQNNFFNLIFSGSLFDKKKAIFINRTTDKLFNLISEISKKNVKDILIFFKADQLEKKSKIRNLFEKDKNFSKSSIYNVIDRKSEQKLIENKLIENLSGEIAQQIILEILKNTK